MKKCVNKIVLTLQTAWALLAVETPVSAHGVDELPGLGRNVTVILSVLWIIIALGIILFVRRLTRRDVSKHKSGGRGPEKNADEPK